MERGRRLPHASFRQADSFGLALIYSSNAPSYKDQCENVPALLSLGKGDLVNEQAFGTGGVLFSTVSTGGII